MSSAGSQAPIPSDGEGEEGFVLLELLVAITVLTIAMLALLPAISGSLKARAHAEAVTLAVEQARSRLDTVGSAEPIREGRSTVILANGWRQRVTIRRLPLSTGASPSPLTAFSVQAIILDGEGDLLTSLSTVRLGATR